ncbi:MAG: tRNA uridine-5-carboxymethylaminomethyl(34) synthesis GTPase MnmE, partial [Flavobacteriales bacterium]|nr:tRNA uridine-5-carboxymethylaminomethyl(34) synthesis GTPase MnmE [Flavobacteriales bacterium]
MKGYADNATICALSSPPGMGAIALIRMSGDKALDIAGRIFDRDLQSARSHSAVFGVIKDGGVPLDEAVAVLFKGPNSFTGEDTVEINCHGSIYIQQKILELLIKEGCRMAQPGEFTLRAFMNGRMDLSQAEAVADLISSESAGAHALAMNQMRGGFSKQIGELRTQLIDFASLIELELDFSEEDVEFADRDKFRSLILEIQNLLKHLIDSFSTGNAIKNGVSVAILGAPNRGKSTLLNSLLNEDRAIVSDIAGTTRDTVEESIVLEGIKFRFIDTAGIRDTQVQIEEQGIKKA